MASKIRFLSDGRSPFVLGKEVSSRIEIDLRHGRLQNPENRNRKFGETNETRPKLLFPENLARGFRPMFAHFGGFCSHGAPLSPLSRPQGKGRLSLLLFEVPLRSQQAILVSDDSECSLQSPSSSPSDLFLAVDI
jgi:hypothetical protein